MSVHSKWSEVEHKATPEQLAEAREEIERGSMLTLIVPRRDLEEILNALAWASEREDNQGFVVGPDEENANFLRIASDLSQQADAQD